jgi:Flp pilus assembly protein TadD
VQSGQLQNALSEFKTLQIPFSLPRRRAQKYHDIGVVCMRLERWQEAKDAFLETIRFDANDFAAYCNLGRLSLLKKDAVKAKEYLAKAMKLDQSCPDVRYLLAQCYIIENDQQGALIELEEADTRTLVNNPLKPAIKKLKEQLRHVSVSH